jgi:hypothetical protein
MASTASGWQYAVPNDTLVAWPAVSQAVADKLEIVAGGRNVGLAPIQTTTITAQTTVSVSGIFSASYDNYKFILNGTSASAGNVASFQIGGNGSSEYKFAEMQVNSSGASPANSSFSNTNTTGRIGVLSNNNSYVEADFYSPFISGFTSWKSFSNRTDSTLTMYSYFGHVANTASYSSISLIFGSAFTGTLRIYGLRNS